MSEFLGIKKRLLDIRENVYAPMVAESHEYQYNADAFEARGGVDMKVETEKEVTRIREDKAR